MSCALLIENLTCQYDAQTVLKSLSLQVNPGEIVCLLGASGCGKTTLLKAIAGLLPLASGQLSLNCVTLDDGKRWLPPEQRNIGMIFQDYALFPPSYRGAKRWFWVRCDAREAKGGQNCRDAGSGSS